MITWLASYPRSGNTFFRIVLHRVFGISTQSVYHLDDGAVKILGKAFTGVGSHGQLLSPQELEASSQHWIVKTHKLGTGTRPFIYLVRDGRDSLVSFAHHELRMAGVSRTDSGWQAMFDEKVIELMNRDSSAGNWGKNVCSWLDMHQTATVPHALVRYEALITDPVAVVKRALQQCGFDSDPSQSGVVPDFAQLHARDAQFFRRGVVGSYVDEMSPALQQQFWSRPQMKRAMQLLDALS